MVRTTHLNSLQALEMAIRQGSLQRAADRMGITPAAVGQRIRALEKYLETDLLLRGRSGLQPTPALAEVLDDLRAGFDALDRVSAGLDFQRSAEIHVVAEPDWSDLWLLPRLDRFREAYPNIHFNVNGEGDVPLRLGAPDIVIDRDPDGRAAAGEPLFTELFLPVGSPRNAARVVDPSGRGRHPLPGQLPVGHISDEAQIWHHNRGGGLEGFPLLHLESRGIAPGLPGWPDWLAAFGYARTGPERGVRYGHIRNALAGVRSDAGLLICGLSLVLDALEEGSLSLLFPGAQSLPAPDPYRMKIRDGAAERSQVRRFRAWLLEESARTARRMEAITGQVAAPG